MKNVISKNSDYLPWTPSGFKDYKKLYPATPNFILPDFIHTQNFSEIWKELIKSEITVNHPYLKKLIHELQNTTIVLIRGFLGNYMPGNLVPILKALKKLGIEAFIAKNSARFTIEENANCIALEIGRQVNPNRQILFLGHSKGGLEAHWIITHYPELMKKTLGIIQSQTPLGPSVVLESLLLYHHRESLSGIKRNCAEQLQRMGLHIIGAQRGGIELTVKRLNKVINELQTRQNDKVLVIQTASWSSRPTTWLDSFHQRLEEVRPGCAHDGQFYLEDMMWPEIPHILLPHLDHAQPVVGGYGFDVAQYWLALMILFMEYRTV